MNWTRCASPGFTVSLNLIHLDLENSTNCEHDALMIFSGNELIKSLCGTLSFMEMQSSINPKLHSAPGGCLSIYFYSDDSFPQVHTGFNAFHQIQDIDECESQSNPCSHLCSNFIGGFRCRCPHGYLLNHNNHTCDVMKCGQPKRLVNGHVKFVKGSKNEYLSIIQYHCNEPFYISKEKQNGNYTCSASQKWRSTGNNILPSCHYVCGQQRFGFGRIWGGKEAPSGSFPWQVHLLNDINRGGGFIIGEKWLMTAAHNMVNYGTTFRTPKEEIKVYAGHNNLDQLGSFIALNISSVYVHANYTTDYDNDIALIKLTSPITFNMKIRPVCLPPKHVDLSNREGSVSGYGVTERYDVSKNLFLFLKTAIMDFNVKLIWIFLIFMNMQKLRFVFTSVMYGEVHSPNYPEHYLAPLDEHWDLEVPPGYHIQLNFNYLKIKPSQDCRNDSLTITYNKTEMKYCGDEDLENQHHPGNLPINIPDTKLKLSLLTNEVNHGPMLPIGFSAFYHAKDVNECKKDAPCTQICINTMGSFICACHYGFKLDADQRTCLRVQCESPKNTNSRIIPVRPTYYYRDVITAQCDIGYKIIIKGEEFSNYTFDCQINGQWSLPVQCQIVHCKSPPPLLNGEVKLISGANNQYRSVMKWQCNRPYIVPDTYKATYTCNADKKWKDDQNNVMPVSPKCVLECGHPVVGLERQKRVIGGHRAPQGAFPWHAYINHNHGGGAVIAKKWILTSASVLMIKNKIIDHKLMKIYVAVRNIQNSQFLPLEIKSLHIHPLYDNADGKHYDNDVALIELEKPILYNADVMPLCLPPQGAEFTPGLTGWVSGFGETAKMKLSRYLRYTSLPLVDNQTCQNFIDNFKIPVALTDNMFCAGVPEGGKDACNGDGGGPLVTKKNGVFWATGIVSWGSECGKPGKYGVYTLVSKYINWINNTMSEN
ncbi:hypothetical protein HF521_017664 [Silurus meridionalis]|uniref:Vitamin K-dependent protein C n=1 Tax=Silurus meridionalis TaxID=175797 RepID=A0A8T0BSQ7_SILME|nr:hypothetical protein HF521_017664 [Silurus meridionalis]